MRRSVKFIVPKWFCSRQIAEMNLIYMNVSSFPTAGDKTQRVLVILVSHLLSRSDRDPPDAVSVRRVAVWESGRGEVSSAVLQVFPTLFNKTEETQLPSGWATKFISSCSWSDFNGEINVYSQ